MIKIPTGLGRRAQSSVIGVILLTAVVILAVGAIGVVSLGLVTEQADASGPLVDVDVSMTDEQVQVSHTMGESLAVESFSVVVENTSSSASEQHSFDRGNVTGDGDGQFEPGETFARNHGFGNGSFQVTVIHESSNTVVHREHVEVTPEGGDDDGGPGSAPTATFAVTTAQPTVGEPVTFDASGSSDPDGTITSYEWEFGDETQGTGPVVGHTYSSSGTFTVTLTVTDDEDRTATHSETIRVEDRPLLRWTTADDWNDAASQDGVVHQPFGDRDPDAIQLGYPASEGGLVGYWPLDEDSGASVASDTTGSNDGTIEGATPGSNGVVRSNGYEFSGDGSGDRVDLADAGAGADEITVATWVRPAHASGTSPSSGPERVLVRGDGSGENSAFDLNWRHDGEGGNTAWFLRIDGGWHGAVDSRQRPADEWHHLVGTYDGEEVRLYVDGALVDATPVQGSIADSTVNTHLSRPSRSSGQEFEGGVDEPRIYDHALDRSEVGALYQSARNGTYTSDWHDADRPLASDRLALDAIEHSVPVDTSTTVVVVESDTDGDGQWDERSDPVGLSSDQAEYDVTGITTNSSRFRLHVSMNSSAVSESPVLSNVTITEGSGSDDAGQFEVSSLTAPDAVDAGAAYETTAVVENVGSAATTQTIQYRFDGSVVERTDVTLAPDGSRTVEFEHTVPADHAGGEVSHGVYGDTDGATGSVDIEVAPTIEQFDVSDESGCFYICQVSYEMSWAVSDSNSNLEEVRITLLNANGDEVGDDVVAVSGSIASDTSTIDPGYGAEGSEYTIEIDAVDQERLNRSESTTDTVDGTDP